MAKQKIIKQPLWRKYLPILVILAVAGGFGVWQLVQSFAAVGNGQISFDTGPNNGSKFFSMLEDGTNVNQWGEGYSHVADKSKDTNFTIVDQSVFTQAGAKYTYAPYRTQCENGILYSTEGYNGIFKNKLDPTTGLPVVTYVSVKHSCIPGSNDVKPISSDIYTANADGTDRQLIITGKEGAVLYPISWMPDDSKLIYTTSTCTKYSYCKSIKARDNNGAIVNLGQTYNSDQVALSGNGKKIAYTSQDSKVHLMNSDGTMDKLLIDENFSWINRNALNYDASKIIYTKIKDHAVLKVYSKTDNKSVILDSTPGTGNEFPMTSQWSPMYDWVVYSKYNKSALTKSLVKSRADASQKTVLYTVPATDLNSYIGVAW